MWAILFMSAFLLANICRANEEGIGAYRISGVEWSDTNDDLILSIKGDSAPTYTMYELFNPFRLIIDIADASIDPGVDISVGLPKGPVSQVKVQILEDKEPFIARIEFFLNADNSYTVERIDNDIMVKFAKPPAPEQAENAEILPEASEEMSETSAMAPAVVESAMVEENPERMSSEPGMQGASVQLDDNNVKEASVLIDIEVEHSRDSTQVLLKSDGPITHYKAVELPKNAKAGRPDRMYIDVKNVKLAGPIPPKTVGTALAQVRTGSRSDGFRVVFDSSLDKLFEYTITEQPDGLLVNIKEPSAATSVIAELMETDSSAEPEPSTSPEPEIIENLETDENLAASDQAKTLTEPDETKTSARPDMRKATSQEDAGDALAFAGYTKQRITVDFYKIDLHNVFRLFGEISNLNIVVDEAVNGSLTLALNDVPWDFALDIILNLKDLQKEERYNTIVISPKSKKFEWPERTLETVEFKTDEKFSINEQQEESIKVSKLQEVPETVVEAKNLIHQAQNLERLSNFSGALGLYEEAYAKWPENTIIAKRIAALCLVRLGQNAKAVHYAKMALKAAPADYDSALQAAIGLARMNKNDQAVEYFEKAVSGPEPSRAALSSYAAFSEEHEQFEHALGLLKRHEDLYGDSLETMITKARIHDKQGHRDLAASEYRTILLSGYEIPADLARYIKGRASLAGQ